MICKQYGHTVMMAEGMYFHTEDCSSYTVGYVVADFQNEMRGYMVD